MCTKFSYIYMKEMYFYYIKVKMHFFLYFCTQKLEKEIAM